MLNLGGVTCDHLPASELPTFLFDNSGLGESVSQRSLIGAGLQHKFHIQGVAPPLLPSKQKKPKRNRKPMDQNRGPKATCQTVHTLDRIKESNKIAGKVESRLWPSKPGCRPCPAQGPTKESVGRWRSWEQSFDSAPHLFQCEAMFPGLPPSFRAPSRARA